jgi:hypothetical protein
MARKTDEERAVMPSKDIEDRGDKAAAEKVGAASVDAETADKIEHDTTTRERTVVSKRVHEPLDAELADDNQPDEDENGPRAAEIGPSK